MISGQKLFSRMSLKWTGSMARKRVWSEIAGRGVEILAGEGALAVTASALASRG